MTTAFTRSNNVRLFETARSAGQLNGVALVVYGIICKEPGLTVGEIYQRYDFQVPGTGRSRGELSKRVSDLVNWGAVKSDGLTVCPYSGKNVQRWSPTGVAPSKEPRLKAVPKVAAASAPAYASFPDLSVLRSLAGSGDLASAAVSLGKALGLSVDSETAKSLAAQARTLSGSFTDRGPELADKDRQIADLKARLTESGERLTQARSEAVPAGASPVQLTPSESLAFETMAGDKGLTHTQLICTMLKTQQQVDAGHLVEKSYVPKTYDAAARDQLSKLAGRTKLVLKFKRFMPKRMVKQAEDTLRALEVAVKVL